MRKLSLKTPWLWLAVLLLLLLAAYTYMGGFKPLKVERVAVNDYHLMGRSFAGSYRSDTIRMYFEEMRSLLDEAGRSDPIVIIYDQEPQGNKGIIKNFIGVFATDKVYNATNLQIRQVIADSAIRVSKQCHPSLMPNPNKIDRLINDQGGTNSEIPNIELYYPNNRLVIERPIKN